jgi:hypothetical protein
VREYRGVSRVIKIVNTIANTASIIAFKDVEKLIMILYYKK